MVFSNNISTVKIPQLQENAFPDLDDIGLAARLRQSVSTLRTWRSRYPERLPPGTRIGRIWLYDKQIVEEWIIAKRKSCFLVELKTSVNRAYPSGKRRGKPSNLETAAAKAIGLSVPAWRAMQEGRAA